MKRICLFIIAIMSMTMTLRADGVRKVEGEFTFYADGSHSRNYAKERALEGARTAALAREFGTMLSQYATQDEQVGAAGEQTYFSSLTSTEVKGEWIADLEPPFYAYDFDNEGNIIVTCKVKGTAKAISNKAVDFEALVLRNGVERQFADTRFIHQDKMRIYFRAPIDGYVNAYLVDADRNVWTLLPYRDSRTGSIKVKHDNVYVFGDPDMGRKMGLQADDYYLTAAVPLEQNYIYVVYSPNEFSKGLDNITDDLLPRSQTYENFARWLTNCRKRDNQMNMKVIPITIQGNDPDAN